MAKTRSKSGTARKSSERKQTCWPGFEPVPGKKPMEKGSCEPKPGRQPKSVRLADQKRAAASKLRKTAPRKRTTKG